MISAKVLADSTNSQSTRLTTFVIEVPRIVWAEFLTHRGLSRNAASSRAIPFTKMREQLSGKPVRFGGNQAGMQDKGVDFYAGVLGWPQEFDGNSGAPLWTPEEAWGEAREHAMYFAEQFHKAGYHKQVVNRLTEPYQVMKGIVTGTEFANFFWLRDDGDADPTIQELARAMRVAYNESKPEALQAGQWHLPFIGGRIAGVDGKPEMYADIDSEGDVVEVFTLQQAIKVSCARCASISYRNEGYGLEKSLEIYESLVGSEKKHASALEHCATPMVEPPELVTECGTLLDCHSVNMPFWPDSWEEGVSHVDRDGNLWSGNIKGFIQYRKLIPGENHAG